MNMFDFRSLNGLMFGLRQSRWLRPLRKFLAALVVSDPIPEGALPEPEWSVEARGLRRSGRRLMFGTSIFWLFVAIYTGVVGPLDLGIWLALMIGGIVHYVIGLCRVSQAHGIADGVLLFSKDIHRNAETHLDELRSLQAAMDNVEAGLLYRGTDDSRLH